MGRDFQSPPGGIYLTLVMRPKGTLEQCTMLTMAAAVGVCRAAEKHLGIHLGIKWVNDLYLSGKKICGILAEGAAAGEKLKYAVVGVGLNYQSPEFTGELANKAGRGGGVYVHNGATLEISNGCIGYNKAVYIYTNGVQNTATAIGGGIATLNSNATITGGTVIGNQAENRGGGIYVYSANQTEKMTFSDGSIGVNEAGNPAPNIANYGGGVYVNNAMFEMTKSGDVSGSITNNIALIDGGGLYGVYAPVTVAGDIGYNIAANNGGGVCLN
ncbi:MAG: hypothetical protein IKA58_06195, partial [Clostridia bacterium]|nr:hypothetical protein [Clostridia bacterium]